MMFSSRYLLAALGRIKLVFRTAPGADYREDLALGLRMQIVVFASCSLGYLSQSVQNRRTNLQISSSVSE